MNLMRKRGKRLPVAVATNAKYLVLILVLICGSIGSGRCTSGRQVGPEEVLGGDKHHLSSPPILIEQVSSPSSISSSSQNQLRRNILQIQTGASLSSLGLMSSSLLDSYKKSSSGRAVLESYPPDPDNIFSEKQHQQPNYYYLSSRSWSAAGNAVNNNLNVNTPPLSPSSFSNSSSSTPHRRHLQRRMLRSSRSNSVSNDTAVSIPGLAGGDASPSSVRSSGSSSRHQTNRLDVLSALFRRQVYDKFVKAKDSGEGSGGRSFFRALAALLPELEYKPERHDEARLLIVKHLRRVFEAGQHNRNLLFLPYRDILRDYYSSQLLGGGPANGMYLCNHFIQALTSSNHLSSSASTTLAAPAPPSSSSTTILNAATATYPQSVYDVLPKFIPGAFFLKSFTIHNVLDRKVYTFKYSDYNIPSLKARPVSSGSIGSTLGSSKSDGSSSFSGKRYRSEQQFTLGMYMGPVLAKMEQHDRAKTPPPPPPSTPPPRSSTPPSDPTAKSYLDAAKLALTNSPSTKIAPPSSSSTTPRDLEINMILDITVKQDGDGGKFIPVGQYFALEAIGGSGGSGSSSLEDLRVLDYTLGDDGGSSLEETGLVHEGEEEEEEEDSDIDDDAIVDEGNGAIQRPSAWGFSPSSRDNNRFRQRHEAIRRMEERLGLVDTLEASASSSTTSTATPVSSEARSVLEVSILTEFKRENVKSDNNCYFRAVARLLDRFGQSPENHMAVRTELIAHISAVIADPTSVLYDEYHYRMEHMLQETPVRLLARLRRAGTRDGWGGLDITFFLANAFLVDVNIFNMNLANQEFTPFNDQYARSVGGGSGGTRSHINLWYEGVHYEALVPLLS